MVNIFKNKCKRYIFNLKRKITHFEKLGTKRMMNDIVSAENSACAQDNVALACTTKQRAHLQMSPLVNLVSIYTRVVKIEVIT